MSRVLVLLALCLPLGGCKKPPPTPPPASQVPMEPVVERLEPLGVYDHKMVAAGETVADPAFESPAKALREKLSASFPDAEFGIGWDPTVLHVSVYGISYETLAETYRGLGGETTNLSAELGHLCATTPAPYTETVNIRAKKADGKWANSVMSWTPLAEKPMLVFGRPEPPPGLPRGLFFADPKYAPAARELLAALQAHYPDDEFAISWTAETLYLTTYPADGSSLPSIQPTELAPIVEAAGAPLSENLMVSSCAPSGRAWVHTQLPWPKPPRISRPALAAPGEPRPGPGPAERTEDTQTAAR